MADKKLQANLTLSTDTDYDCTYSDTFEDVFVSNFVVENLDKFTQIQEGTRTKGLGSIETAKAVLIKNTGNICAEILITAQDYKDTSSVDAANNVDVGGGGATKLRSFSMLLPAQRFVFLPWKIIINIIILNIFLLSSYSVKILKKIFCVKKR